MYLDIVSVSSDICLCVKSCCAKTAVRLSRDFLANKNIVTLPWPTRSLDLAPIEHNCGILGCNARSRHNVRKRPQMIVTLRREWAAIPQNDIKIMVGSSPAHCLNAGCWRPYVTG